MADPAERDGRASADSRLRTDDVRRAARDVLGHRTLLPGQAEAVRAIVSGRDTLALLPTGGGKSAIYQLAGLERPGATLVVSPLVALQQDQLDGLRELELPAAALNASLPEREREAALAGFASGDLEFLLLAPEQLASTDTLARVGAARPSLLVVDEAHCVSEWGHDFRPEYRRLRAVRAALGDPPPPILAMTGTASPPVREEIVRWLGLEDPAIVARGFDRPEIFLEVTRYPETARKRAALLDWVAAAEGAGIVYVATRGATTELAGALVERGVTAEPYHAGLGARRRASTLDRFLDGEVGVVVATIAFGMGVDKPDVRFVAHHDPSDSLDAYHQEIGRAGRDGDPAAAHLFFDPADLGLRRFQSVPASVSREDAVRVVKALRQGPAEIRELARRAKLGAGRAEHVVGRLEALEAVRVAPDGTVEPVELDQPGLPDAVAAEQERRREHARSRVELLRGYADTAGCRRRFLLNALGEELPEPCGNCDNCRAGLAPEAEVDLAAAPFAINERVVHATFGEGEVARIEGDRVVVRFDRVGYRTLALDSVLDSGLLRDAS